MSGVDVLSVMDRAAAAMQFERDDHKYHRPDIAGWWDRLLIDTNAARAAVAELIEAADKVQLAYALMNLDPDFIRLRKALARVSGGAA